MRAHLKYMLFSLSILVIEPTFATFTMEDDWKTYAEEELARPQLQNKYYQEPAGLHGKIIGTNAASELSPFHIAVLEDSTFIENVPFASRVDVFAPSDLVEDEELKEHGVAVCSVLVGKNSPLPEDISVTIVPNLNQFSLYLNTQKPNDLVILNWSGCAGYPGLSEDVLEGLDNISSHFNSILKMNVTEFTAQVDEYIEAYDNMLEQLPQDDNPLSSLLNYAKTCLLNVKATEKSTRREEDKDSYSLGVSEKIDYFKKHAEARAKLRFEEMKAALLKILRQHDNTLIVWALGNDGECVDTDPFWQELLDDELILSHTILVHGLQTNGRKDMNSNFTKLYSEHALGKPYNTQVWDIQKSRYIQTYGTSFSAPLTTIDAFIEAKKVLDQTGQNPFYSDVKRTLLRHKNIRN